MTPMRSNAEPTRLRSVESDSPGTPPLGPGSVLDRRYRLESVVGHGGTATVYRASDELLGRTVAVKVFSPHLTDPVMVARQQQEMRVVAGLHHPHLVAVFDARMAEGHSGGEVAPGYLVLEFMGGQNLAARLHEGAMTPAEVAVIGMGISSAMAIVHAAGLVHRDIKPANILLTATGEAKLSDFGIARVLQAERITHSADVLGTAPYLSPEQARGEEIGPATDIYALGLVLLECLTGHREFPGPAVEAAVARLLREPVIPDTLPTPWPDLLRGMTATPPETRPGATDVCTTLAGNVHPTEVSPTKSLVSPERRTIAMGGTLLGDSEPSRPELTLALTAIGHKPRPIRTFLMVAMILAVGAVAAAVVVALRNQSSPASTSPVADTPSSTSSAQAPAPVETGQPVQITASSVPVGANLNQPATTGPDSTVPEPTEPSSLSTPVEPAAQSPSTTVGAAGNGNKDNGNGNGGNGNGNNGPGNNGNGNNGNGNNGNGNGGNGNGENGENGNGR
jgi:serine/threonine protein kinase